jgi:hypothetical protein
MHNETKEMEGSVFAWFCLVKVTTFPVTSWEYKAVGLLVVIKSWKYLFISIFGKCRSNGSGWF